MHAAARYNGNVGALTDIKIVVHQVVHVAVGDTSGNINLFTGSARLNPDIDTGFIGFGDNLHIAGGFPSGTGAVLPNIVSAVGFPEQIGNHFQQLFCHVFHDLVPAFRSSAVLFRNQWAQASSPPGQYGQRCSAPSKVGRISSRGPSAIFLPPDSTTI